MQLKSNFIIMNQVSLVVATNQSSLCWTEGFSTDCPPISKLCAEESSIELEERHPKSL